MTATDYDAAPGPLQRLYDAGWQAGVEDEPCEFALYMQRAELDGLDREEEEAVVRGWLAGRSTRDELAAEADAARRVPAATFGLTGDDAGNPF